MQAAQIEAFEKGALLRVMPELATLVVTGDERQSWLAGMLTADIGDRGPGHGVYALSVDKNGKLQAEVWVAIDDERILLGVHKDCVAAVLEHLDRYLIMEDADIARDEGNPVWWLAHGPLAEQVARVARDNDCMAVVGRLGDIDTAIIVAPHAGAPNTAEMLATTKGAVLATPSGWERIRIENMLPRYGVDFAVGCYPQQASLENLAVSFNKGCYIGQEAVYMLEKRGHVNKRLVRLVLDGVADLDVGADIHDADGKVVGSITSSTGAGDHTIAMGSVRYKHTLSGTELVVAGHKAQVSCLSAREETC